MQNNNNNNNNQSSIYFPSRKKERKKARETQTADGTEGDIDAAELPSAPEWGEVAGLPWLSPVCPIAEVPIKTNITIAIKTAKESILIAI